MGACDPLYIRFGGVDDLLCLGFGLGGRRWSEAVRAAVAKREGRASGARRRRQTVVWSRLGFRVCGGDDGEELR
jgi:hypothetical protein